jgi:AcrR family transcriptional regulator
MSVCSLRMLTRMAATVERAGKRASALPPDERRSSIVAATLPLLLEHGEMATTRQIAEAAGVAEGTIFRAFVDKDELIAAVIEAAFDPGPLEAAVAAIDDGLPFVDQVVAATAILQERVVNIWRLMSAIGPRHHPGPQRRLDSPALEQLFARHRDRLVVEPARAAWVLRAFTLSATHPSLVEQAMPATEVVDLFLHGVEGPGPSC